MFKGLHLKSHHGRRRGPINPGVVGIDRFRTLTGGIEYPTRISRVGLGLEEKHREMAYPQVFETCISG